jgi:hypothetical protein
MAEVCPPLKEATVEITDAPDNQHGYTGFWKMSIYRSSFISVGKSMKIAILICIVRSNRKRVIDDFKFRSLFHTSSQPTTLGASWKPAPTSK